MQIGLIWSRSFFFFFFFFCSVKCIITGSGFSSLVHASSTKRPNNYTWQSHNVFFISVTVQVWKHVGRCNNTGPNPIRQQRWQQKSTKQQKTSINGYFFIIEKELHSVSNRKKTGIKTISPHTKAASCVFFFSVLFLKMSMCHHCLHSCFLADRIVFFVVVVTRFAL